MKLSSVFGVWLLLVAGMAPMGAVALEDRIRALQPPVWVVSDGERSAAFPGQQLAADDEVITGARGKAILALAEGSDVKLGNEARLVLNIRGMAGRADTASEGAGGERNSPDEDSDDLYQATLDVIKGAFRFTTTELGKRFRRDVRIKAGAVATVGIRGTDVWGRAGPQSSFVALIEGQISITRQDGSELSLDEPLTVFEASTEAPTGATRQVPLSAVQQLAPETELDSGQGVLAPDGPFRVYLVSLAERSAAERRMTELRERGYPVSLFETTVDGQRWFRLGVDHFASLADGRYFRDQAASLNLGSGAWLANSP